MGKAHPLITLYDLFYDKFKTPNYKPAINDFTEINKKVTQYGSEDLSKLVEDVEQAYLNPKKKGLLEQSADTDYFIEKTGKHLGGRIRTILDDYPTNADVLHLYLAAVHLTTHKMPKRTGPIIALWLENYLHAKRIIRKPVLLNALEIPSLVRNIDDSYDLPHTPRQQWSYKSLEIFKKNKT